MVFRIKGIFPFDPIRRIMSIVVEAENGDVVMFSKGADSAMFSRCKLEQTRRDKLQKQSNSMASKSYRTLVLAMKPFDANMVN